MSASALIFALVSALSAPPSTAQGASAPSPSALRPLTFTPNLGGERRDEPLAGDGTGTAVIPELGAAEPFGAAGSNWLTFGGGIAYDLDDSTDANLRAAFSHFLVEGVEVSPELNLWYHDQAESDEWGINPAVVFRWHVWRGDDWTLFADAGIGALFTTDSVPTSGTHVNFTPRVGVGVTYNLPSLGGRLQAGLRWHHISNARITGDRGNPATDAPMVYIGLMIPF